MITLNSLQGIKDFIKENEFVLLYFSSNSCSVCVELYPKLNRLLESYPNIKGVKIEIDKLLICSGEFSVFTLPCVLVYFQEKEIIREARFISIEDLKKKIERYELNL